MVCQKKTKKDENLENKLGTDNNLETVMCTWRKTMQNNLNGIGTTFSRDISTYSPEQLRCYRCSGLETQLPCYFPDEDEEVLNPNIDYTAKPKDFVEVCGIKLKKVYQDY